MPAVTNSVVSINFKIAAGAIAIYNSLEVIGLIFMTFRKYSTLYFWAMLACAFGILLFTASFIDLFFELYKEGSTMFRPLVLLTIGWYGMVTGFSLVMYSRLHLINVPKQYIKYISYFIIYNILFSHFPTTTFTFGSFLTDSYFWDRGYEIIEKIQMTMFFIQEVILSTLYLHFIQRMTYERKFTPLVKNTMVINCIVLALDVAMLGIEYGELYEYQIMLKAAVYSIKLKMEFYILNVLTKSLNHNATQKGEIGWMSDDHHQSKNKAGVVSPTVPRNDSNLQDMSRQHPHDSQTA